MSSFPHRLIFHFSSELVAPPRETCELDQEDIAVFKTLVSYLIRPWIGTSLRDLSHRSREKRRKRALFRCSIPSRIRSKELDKFLDSTKPDSQTRHSLTDAVLDHSRCSALVMASSTSPLLTRLTIFFGSTLAKARRMSDLVCPSRRNCESGAATQNSRSGRCVYGCETY